MTSEVLNAVSVQLMLLGSLMSTLVFFCWEQEWHLTCYIDFSF